MESKSVGAIVYDPVVEGSEHAPFNYSLVSTAAIAFEPHQILFWASASHIEYLAHTTGLFRDHNVVPVPIENAPRRVRDTSRIKWELRNFLRAIRSAKRTQCRRLIVVNATTSTLFTLIFAHLHSRIFGISVSISVVLHSVLAEVWGWRSRNPLRRCFDTHSAMVMLSRIDVRVWVLEDPIRRELVAAIPRIAPKVGVFPHPVRDDECVAEAPKLSEPVRFGFLGRASRAKNFDIFLEVASTVRQVAGARAEFLAVGARADDFTPELLANLADQPTYVPLQRQDYLALIRKLHYVIILNGHMYRYIASGSALDAIAALRPLIALDVPGSRDFLTSYGDIGFLCRDKVELAQLAVDLALRPDPIRYTAQVNNLVTLREARLPKRLAKNLQILADMAP